MPYNPELTKQLNASSWVWYQLTGRADVVSYGARWVSHPGQDQPFGFGCHICGGGGDYWSRADAHEAAAAHAKTRHHQRDVPVVDEDGH